MNDITPPPAGIRARVWGFFKKRYSGPYSVLFLILDIPFILVVIISIFFFPGS